MENSTKKSIDSRIVPAIRNLKDKPEKKRREFKSKTNIQEEIHKNNYNQEQELQSEKDAISPKNKLSTSSRYLKKHFSDKIYIDGGGGIEQKTKQFTTYNKPIFNNNNNIINPNKVKKISKTKEIIQQNPLLSKTAKYNSYIKSIDFNLYKNVKSKKTYVQNLLNSASMKKYKNSCIDFIKNDGEIKNMYEMCGFEKNNASYENFIFNNFFNKEIFLLKLELLFFDEKNLVKKNFKENFFKKEIKKYLKKCIEENNFKNQINNLNETFQDTFSFIKDFDLYHN
jgi:hypothetical protein